MGSLIRLVAIVTSGIVLLGFGFFVVGQMNEGSKTQQRALDHELDLPDSQDAIDPPSDVEKIRESQNDKFHELVDDANDVLLAPFVSLVDSSSAWIDHGVTALLALLLYGVGLGFLANLLPKPRSRQRDWRTVES